MTQKRCHGCMQPITNAAFCPHCGYPARKDNESHQLHTGTMLLQRYLVGKVLGQGGFGITYLGWDCQRGTTVAIKEYYPAAQVTRDTVRSNELHCYSENQTAGYNTSKERFLREAKALSRLEDVPAIVKIQDCFELNNTVYIIMEYIQGTDLRHYIARRGAPLNPKELLAILRPVMDALKTVHDRGLVHRDISPDNIMLHPTRGAVLLDFGAVRDVQNADVNAPLTKSTEAILKHGFAPLEQYRSRGSLGPWTDVYALCATIYYCLTRKVPPEALARMMGEEVLDWSVVPELTVRQRHALEKGMAIHAKDRTASIDLLMEQLYPTKPVSKPETTPEKPPVPEIPVSPPPRKPVALIAGIAGVVIAAGIGAALLLGGTDATPTMRETESATATSTADTRPAPTQAHSYPATEATGAAAALPSETQAPAVPATFPSPGEDFLMESTDRVDTVYYSSSSELNHEAIECTWHELPIRVSMQGEDDFTQQTTQILLRNYAREELSLDDYPFACLWDGNSVEIYVPQGLPEGIYDIMFRVGSGELNYVISVGTPGQIYTVNDSEYFMNASIYHEESELYLHYDGARLSMVAKDQRTFFRDPDEIFRILYGDGSDPLSQDGAAFTIREIHVQGSRVSSHYLLCYGDHYLGYNDSTGLFLTTQLSEACYWDIHRS